jgi:hypothetical protein
MLSADSSTTGSANREIASMQVNTIFGESGKQADQPSDTCQPAAAEYERSFVPHC